MPAQTGHAAFIAIPANAKPAPTTNKRIFHMRKRSFLPVFLREGRNTVSASGIGRRPRDTRPKGGPRR